MDKPILSEITYKFIQEGNCNGSTCKSDEDEELIITHESCLDSLDDESGFYVIRTTGWSFESPDELLNLFERIKNVK